MVVRGAVVAAVDVGVVQRAVGAFGIEIFVEVMQARYPVQAVGAGGGQAKLLGKLAAVCIAVATLQFQRGAVAVAKGVALERFERGDRGQLQATQLPDQVEVATVLLDARGVLGVVVHVALLGIDVVAELVIPVQPSAVVHGAGAAGVVVAAAVEVDVGFQVIRQHGEQLQADRIIFQRAAIVAIGLVLVIAVVGLVTDRHPSGELVVYQRTADRTFYGAVGVVAHVQLVVAVFLESRFFLK